MKKVYTVIACRLGCKLFKTDMDGMHCGHPYWKDKGAYSDMIIRQDNSGEGQVPDECPLKIENLNIEYKLKNSLK